MHNRRALLSLLLLTCVRAQNGPPNDDLANAIVFTLRGDLPESLSVDSTEIANATLETDEVVCEWDRSWWYAFTPRGPTCTRFGPLTPGRLVALTTVKPTP